MGPKFDPSWSSPKSSAVSPDTVPKSPAGLEPLQYHKTNRVNPSNYGIIRQLWCDWFRTNFGQAGTFLSRGKYFEVPLPDLPSELNVLDKSSIEYEVLKATYISEVNEVNKINAKYKRDRVKMYTAVWTALPEEARNDIRRDETFDAIDQLGNDPLALTNLIAKYASAVLVSDTVGTQVNATDAFGLYRQRATMSLAEFNLGINARVEQMRACKSHVPDDLTLAVNYVNKLDPVRYGSMQNAIHNKMLPRPATMLAAFNAASD